MSALRIGFVGSSHLGLSGLSWLLGHEISLGIQLVGVIGRQASGASDDLLDLVEHVGEIRPEIPTIRLTRHEQSELISQAFGEWKPDLALCIGWNWMIPNELLSVPRYGFVGYHPSLLPRNRGRHPIIWAIALRLEKTGSTLFRLSERVDDGEILSRRAVALGQRETATSLYRKLTETLPDQLEEVISERRYRFEFEGLKSDGPASYWRKRLRLEGRIDWRMAAVDIDALVRALTWPYSGAECLDPRSGLVKTVEKAEPFWGTLEPGLEPGRVLARRGDELLIACGSQSAIWLIEHGLGRTYGIGESLVIG